MAPAPHLNRPGRPTRWGLTSPHALALGIERLGLVSLRFPVQVALCLLALAILAAVGTTRIKVDDSLSQLFRSNTQEFRQYEAVTRQFPSHEFDVLVVVEGQKLLARDSLMQLRDLAADLQLVDGTRGIISIFSARAPPQDHNLPAPLFPADLPKGDAYKTLVDRVLSNDIIRGKLLSLDGELTLIVLALDPDIVESERLGGVIGEIQQTVDDDLQGLGLKAQLSGVPVMQLETREAVERDRLLYNAIGFVAGCAIAMAFFRRLSFMIIAAGPPLMAILFTLGALGWLGFRLNIFLNVMTPLIMVISFSDSMQLTFAARDGLIAGENRYEAFRNAILVVGPACVITHATAALSFIALQFSQSDLIRSFGQAGLIATIIALLTVLLLAPSLGVLLIRNETQFAATVKGADMAVDALRRFCGWVAARMVRRARLYSLASLIVVGGLAAIYSSLEPRYRLADQVPDRQQAVAASARLDAKLTGANPIDVLIEFPKGASLYDAATLQTIADAHAEIEKQAGVGNVWSLETLRRWLAEKAGRADVTTLRQYVGMLPEHLVRRFISANEDSALVSARVPDLDASELLPLIERLDAALNDVRAAHPGYAIAVTGLPAIAARNSASMIGRLNRALTIEVLFVAAFIGLVFRSVAVMLATVMPAIFPIVVAGTVLRATGEGLQFASVVALTVSFGLGLSATIHFLNRLRAEAQRGAPPSLAVERATVLMGPALMLTSFVLACGLISTVLSDLPSLRLFGWLSSAAMILALVADLTILRPTITALLSWTEGRGAASASRSG